MFEPQEDERILRKLLGKVKVQAEQDEGARAQHAAAEEAALRQILRKYTIADADIKALMEWKHSNYVSRAWLCGFRGAPPLALERMAAAWRLRAVASRQRLFRAALDQRRAAQRGGMSGLPCMCRPSLYGWALRSCL